jgi:hypothetical protein
VSGQSCGQAPGWVVFITAAISKHPLALFKLYRFTTISGCYHESF